MNNATEATLLSVVVPTLNEARNLRPLFHRITRALRGIRHEILICDDASSDGTADVAESLRMRYPSVRVIRRAQNFGLSAAVLDGFSAARGSALAVIDADLQHDPRVLPQLLQALDAHELAIGSRYAFQGKTCGWSLFREIQSRFAAWLTRRVLRISVRDPLSGFFAMRRSLFDELRTSVRADGWKLLLEFIAGKESPRLAEVPFVFRARQRGVTKMNGQVIRAWLRSLVRLRAVRSGLAQAQVAAPQVLGLEVVA